MPTENVPLLRTKLHRPEPGPGHIPRPHLLNYLNHNSQRKLTLVSAPAGFGKTTLMAEWLQIGPRQVAWLSLDEADRNFVRFMRYIVAALQTIWPAMGLDLMSLLQAPKLPPVPYLATSLINDLVDRPEPFVLVLDDVHLVESAEITQFLEMVIEYFPPQG
ncbi:MAG: AAA family ATPase, partial [Anaerolineae bacterium]|nr:AAA family ATPase [Anaerolineae bacterium]